MSDIEIRSGRQPLSRTDVHDWVSLAPISPEAHSLYVKLCMHVNQKRGDGRVWPGTDTLAVLMGRSRGDKVTPLLDELIALGAVEKRREGMPARNVYVVHSTPPDGYEGPTTLAAWYEVNKPALAVVKQTQRAKREQRRQRAKPQVTLDTPKSGEQGLDTPVRGYQDTPESGYQDTPVRGEHDTPVRGEHVPPVRGRELTEVELAEVEPPPIPPAPPAASTVAEPETREGEGIDQLLREVLAAAPHWSPTRLGEVLAEPDIDARPAAIVREALLMLARGEFGPTDSPRRLLADGPWWAAARQRASPRRPKRATEQPKPPCEPCGTTGRVVRTEGAGRQQRDVLAPCPACDPRPALRLVTT